MSTKVSTKKGCHTHVEYEGMTQTERHIYIMLTKEFLTPTQIKIRRQTSRQTVNKHIQNLKKKGFINSSLQCVNQKSMHPSTMSTKMSTKRTFRYHAEEWNIQIIWKGEKYKRLLQKGNILNVDGNTIRLYNSSIEVYSGHSYFGENINELIRTAIDYDNRLFTRLESELDIAITKERTLNKKLVKAHIADLNNEVAKDYSTNGEELKIKGTDDGKVWFIGDYSLNKLEGEYIHPKEHKEDSIKVTKHLNDFRDNDPPTISELMSVLKQQITVNAESTNIMKEQAAGLNSVIQFLKSQLPKEIKIDKNQNSLKEYVG